jgi:hypothetical protein
VAKRTTKTPAKAGIPNLGQPAISPTPTTVAGIVEQPMVTPPPKKGDALTRGGTSSGRLGQIVTAANRWRENYNPSRALTMRRVVELQELGQRGDTAYLQWTYRKMERSYPTLSALITRCENPLLNFDWEVRIKEQMPKVDEATLRTLKADPELRAAVEKALQLKEPEPENGKPQIADGKAEEAAESQVEQDAEEKEVSEEELNQAYLKAAAERQQRTLRDAYDRIDNLKAAVQHLHMAEFRGYAHLQKHRDENGDVYHLEPLNQWCVCRDGLEGNWWWNPDSRSTSQPAQFLGKDYCIGGETLPLEDFIIREVPRPIDEIALTLFVRYGLCEKDADGFIEIYGIPGGVVIMPGNVPQGKESEYEGAAQRVAEGGSGALPNGSDYKPNDGPRGVDPFTPRLKHLQEELVLAGTGGKLTMLAESGSGTLAGGAHADTFEEIADGRAQKISERFQRDFDPEVLSKRHPEEPILVYFKYGKPDSDAKETVAFTRDMLKSLATHELLARVVANQTDLKETVRRSGLTVNEEYTDPYVPTVDAQGVGISGELQRDQAGNIIGAQPQASANGAGGRDEDPNEAFANRPKPNIGPDGKLLPKPGDLTRGGNGNGQIGPGGRPSGQEPEPGPEPIKNRGGVQDAPSQDLEEAGTDAYARALAHDLQVMREECESLLNITDDRVLAQRAVALADKLDALKEDLTHLPKSAQALAETMIAALFTGLTEAQQKTKEKAQ